MNKWIPLIGGHIVVLLYAWSQHFLAAGVQQRCLILSDACFILAVMLGGLGILELISRTGQFYGLQYALYLVKRRFIPIKGGERSLSYGEFIESKGEKKNRLSAWPLVAAGLYFFLGSLLFLFLFHRV